MVEVVAELLRHGRGCGRIVKTWQRWHKCYGMVEVVAELLRLGRGWGRIVMAW